MLPGEDYLYDTSMTRVYLADAHVDERAARRLLLLDLKMEVVGEAAEWGNTLTQAPGTLMDMLLVDWDLLPANLGVQALAELRLACPNAIVVVMISHLDARHQAALSVGTDYFLDKTKDIQQMTNILVELASKIGNSPAERLRRESISKNA